MPGRDSAICLSPSVSLSRPICRLFLLGHYLQSFGLHPLPFPQPRPGPIGLCLFEAEFGCAWSFRILFLFCSAFASSFSTNSTGHNHYRQHLFTATPLQFFALASPTTHTLLGVARCLADFVPLPCNLYLLHRFVCANGPNSLCMLSIFGPPTEHRGEAIPQNPL